MQRRFFPRLFFPSVSVALGVGYGPMAWCMQCLSFALRVRHSSSVCVVDRVRPVAGDLLTRGALVRSPSCSVPQGMEATLIADDAASTTSKSAAGCTGASCAWIFIVI